MTKAQSKVFKAIREFIDKHGYSPSYEEIGRAVGRRSGSVSATIQRLADRGHIKKCRRWRSIEILKAA